MRNPRKGPCKLMLRLLPLAILLSLHPEAQCAPRTMGARERLAAMYGYPPGWNKPPDKAERSSYNGNLSPGYGIGADSSANTYDNANNAKSPEYDAAPKAIHPEKTSSFVNGDSEHGNRVQPASSDQVEPGKSSEFARVQSGKANTAVQVRGRRHMETSDEPIDYQELVTSTPENVGEDEETRRLTTMEYRTVEEAVTAEREMRKKAEDAARQKDEDQKRLLELDGQLKTLNDNLKKFESAKDEKDKIVERQQTLVTHGNERLVKLRENAVDANKTIEAKAKEINELRTSLTSDKTAIDGKNEEMKGVDSQIDSVTKELEKLQNDRTIMKADIPNAVELGMQMTKLEESLEQIRQQLTEAENNNAITEEELGKKYDNMLKSIDELQQQINDVPKKKAQIEAALATLDASIVTKKNRLRELHTQQELLNDQIGIMNEEYEQNRKDLESKRKRIKTLPTFEKIQQDIMSEERQNTNRKKLLEKSREELHELTEKIRTAQSDPRFKEVEALKRSIDAADLLIHRNTKGAKRAKDEIERLSSVTGSDISSTVATEMESSKQSWFGWPFPNAGFVIGAIVMIAILFGCCIYCHKKKASGEKKLAGKMDLKVKRRHVVVDEQKPVAQQQKLEPKESPISLKGYSKKVENDVVPAHQNPKKETEKVKDEPEKLELDVSASGTGTDGSGTESETSTSNMDDPVVTVSRLAGPY